MAYGLLRTSADGSIFLQFRMTASAPQDQFEHLTILVHQLHEIWVAYAELFNRTRERVDEMNRRTGFIFFLINSAIENEIILGIAKALDGDGRTLSLRKAIAGLPEPARAVTKEQRKTLRHRKTDLLRQYDHLRVLCGPILEHRDKRIAHHERAVVMGAQILPEVSVQRMQDAMTGIASLCDQISIARTGSTGIRFVGADIDVEPSCRALYWALRAGNRLLDETEGERRMLLKRMADGEIVENYQERLPELNPWFD